MPASPKINSDEKALVYLREQLERVSTSRMDSVELLWTIGDRFVIGVEHHDSRTPKTVYVVGPRGGIDRWISTDEVTAPILARFLR